MINNLIDKTLKKFGVKPSIKEGLTNELSTINVLDKFGVTKKIINAWLFDFEKDDFINIKTGYKEISTYLNSKDLFKEGDEIPNGVPVLIREQGMSKWNGEFPTEWDTWTIYLNSYEINL